VLQLLLLASYVFQLLCISFLLPAFICFCFCSPRFYVNLRFLPSSVAMLRPQRISSEAPEVVPPQPDLLYVAESESHLDRFKRKKGTQYEKQLADHQSPGLDKRSPPMASDIPGNGGGYETPASVSSPRGTERAYQTPGPSYDLSPYEVQMAPNPRHGGRKVCGLITTIILVIVAFIIGGGVGGGIGGAIAVKNKDKSR
jgi:hypothetical protein